MNKKQTARLYEEHVGAIRKAAWAIGGKYTSHAENTPDLVEELIGVGNLTFMKCTKTHQQDKGDFRQFLNGALRNQMLSHVYHVWRAPAPVELLPEAIDPHATPDKECQLKQWQEGLSEDAKFIVTTILESPDNVLTILNMKPKLLRGDVKRFLRNHGWTFQRIKNTFDHIGEALGAL